MVIIELDAVLEKMPTDIINKVANVSLLDVYLKGEMDQPIHKFYFSFELNRFFFIRLHANTYS